MAREGDIAHNKAGGAAVYRGGAWHVFAANQGEYQTIKAIAQGRMAIPSGAALRNPRLLGLINAVSLYDPSFDVANQAGRVATRKDFTSGKSAQNITSLNTAIGHLGSLKQAADEMHNSGLPIINMAENAIAGATGSARTSKFNLAKQAVADELTRAFRGTGGSLHEVEDWQKKFDAASSPEQINTSIRAAVDLLHSRIDAVGDQYSRGMGRTSDPMRLLNPHAVQTLKMLEGGQPAAVPAAPHGAVQPHAMSDADIMKAIGGG